jgi:hypothetical protein
VLEKAAALPMSRWNFKQDTVFAARQKSEVGAFQPRSILAVPRGTPTGLIIHAAHAALASHGWTGFFLLWNLGDKTFGRQQ